ncbi:MAG: hypothetical protein MZV64_32975 [Ignavibacteriales bacterium]|nr:hypothetical protein [Ignavibacteriales bacterium]
MTDYHEVLPARMKELVQFIEEQARRSDKEPLLHRHRSHPRTRPRATRGHRLDRQEHHVSSIRKQGSVFFPVRDPARHRTRTRPDLSSPTTAAPARAASLPAPPSAILPNRTLDATTLHLLPHHRTQG